MNQQNQIALSLLFYQDFQKHKIVLNLPLFCHFCSCEPAPILIDQASESGRGTAFFNMWFHWSIHGRQFPEVVLGRHFSCFDGVCRRSLPGLSLRRGLIAHTNGFAHSAVLSTALFAFWGDRPHLSHVAAMKADVDCKAHSC